METETNSRVIQAVHDALADRYFFETVVRLHRAGEGEPYTGLKPVGSNIDPVIRAADKAIEVGSPEALVKLFPEDVRAEIEKRFSVTLARKKFHRNDVEAGREYVEAYISLLEYLEHLHERESRYHSGLDSCL